MSVSVCMYTHIFTLQSPANILAKKVQWLIVCLDSLHLTPITFAVKCSCDLLKPKNQLLKVEDCGLGHPATHLSSSFHTYISQAAAKVECMSKCEQLENATYIYCSKYIHTYGYIIHCHPLNDFRSESVLGLSSSTEDIIIDAQSESFLLNFHCSV